MITSESNENWIWSHQLTSHHIRIKWDWLWSHQKQMLLYMISYPMKSVLINCFFQQLPQLSSSLQNFHITSEPNDVVYDITLNVNETRLKIVTSHYIIHHVTSHIPYNSIQYNTIHEIPMLSNAMLANVASNINHISYLIC